MQNDILKNMGSAHQAPLQVKPFQL